MSFKKLSELVGQEIYIKEVGQWTFKKWDVENKKMLTSDKPQEGFKKVYQVQHDKGTTDISAHQIGQMLEGVSANGQSQITGRTFTVKSNGKTGKDIRYFIDPVYNPDNIPVEHTHTVEAQPTRHNTGTPLPEQPVTTSEKPTPKPLEDFEPDSLPF